ncbi:MAG TPA: nuclear transport factor 2 family protein [Telluria sp.]|nr:nuclear transport factor 2 family protein [Telluria sp.]
MTTPEDLIQRQLDAYNARDIDALLATYAPDARQYEHPGKLLATGAAEMRERMALRFQEPNLHARLLQRVVMGNIVIDHEEVTRTFPEGTGRVDMVAIYEVVDGKIQSASVQVSNKRLDV